MLIDDKKQTKRISSEIIKMDENNQYGMAMTKPLPYGCIKKKRIALLPLLNLIKLQMKFLPRTLWGHLFIVDIKFNDINPKTSLFNELSAPIFEKNGTLREVDTSTFKYYGKERGKRKKLILPIQL